MVGMTVAVAVSIEEAAEAGKFKKSLKTPKFGDKSSYNRRRFVLVFCAIVDCVTTVVGINEYLINIDIISLW